MTHVVGHASHYDLRHVLISEVTAIYGWLAKVPAAGPAAAAVAGALPERNCAGHGRAGPVAEGLGPRGRPWLQVRGLPGLGRLLARSGARVGRFPLRKDRRQHLHRIIDGRKCDCTHVTERKGSPQTLVCTKTQASYERRLEQFHSDLESLQQLETLSTAGNPRPARPKRTSARAVKKKRQDKGG